MNAPIKGQQELEGIVSRTISAFIISRDDMLSNTFCQMGTAFFGHALGMIFMHRGDSPGESGSNVYFLADKKSRHEPCGMLFSKLSVKLADRALIVTDGSNTGIKRLKAFHNQNIAGAAAYSAAAQAGLSHGGFDWKCVGYMSNRYGPTLVWGVTRTEFWRPDSKRSQL